MSLSMDDLIELYWDEFLLDSPNGNEELVPSEMKNWVLHSLKDVGDIWEELKNGIDLKTGKEFDFNRDLVGWAGGDALYSFDEDDEKSRAEYGKIVILETGLKKPFFEYCREMGYTD